MQKLRMVVFVVVLAEDEVISHDSCWCGPWGGCHETPHRPHRPQIQRYLTL